MNQSHPWSFRLLEFVTAAVIGLSLTALIGHLAHVPRLLAWDGGTPMSINTITLELLEGIGFVALCVGLRRRPTLEPVSVRLTTFGPVDVIAVFSVLTCGVLIWERISVDFATITFVSVTTFYFGRVQGAAYREKHP